MSGVYLTGIKIEMKLAGIAGDWTDVSADYMQNKGISVSRGARSVGPLDRVAPTGVMYFYLDNSANNSAGLVGYYSPGHTNCRTGFEAGVVVRLRLQYDGTWWTKFYGRIPDEGITVAPGLTGERKTEVEVVDYMDMLATHEIDLPTLAENKKIEEAVPLILANMSIQPLSTSYGIGEDTFSFIFDTVPRRGTALSELVKLAQSELGYIYVKPTKGSDEVLVVEGRMQRSTAALAGIFELTELSNYLTTEDGSQILTEDGLYYLVIDSTTSIDLTDQQIGMSPKHGAHLANIITATAYPRSVDVSAVVLFSLNTPIQLSAGATKSGYRVTYRDPNAGVSAVAGKDMITPVATTDYQMFANSNGTGTDLTANLTVVVTYGVNGAEYALTNTGATPGYVTKLQARGYGIYTYDPVSLTSESSTSKAIHGNKTLNIDMRYQDDPSIASGYASVVLTQYGTPRNTVESVSFAANRNYAMMGAYIQIDLGDRIHVSESVTGVDEDYFINGLDFTISGGGAIEFTWHTKSSAFDTYEYSIWDTDLWDVGVWAF